MNQGKATTGRSVSFSDWKRQDVRLFNNRDFFTLFSGVAGWFQQRLRCFQMNKKMTKQKSRRVRFVGLKFTAEEFKKIEASWKKSTHRKLSDYLRPLVLGKPITLFTRDQSLDDFMAELIKLRNELIRVGNNYNQVVYKLHTMRQFSDIRTWLISHENAGKMLQQRLDSIQTYIDKADAKWLQ